jgi:hypothetical protein
MGVPIAFPGGRIGRIDNLLMTDDGHLVVVEMKLWRNPEAIREVVGQIFHYGVTLEAIGVPAIEAALTRCEEGVPRLMSGRSLIEYAIEQFEIEDERAFSSALASHLRNGELLYLIAGDGIRVSVDAISMWINARSGSPFRFGLVKLDIYETERAERLTVSRVRVKTAEIGRHVVEVKVSGPGSELVQVHIDEQIVEETGAFREERREVKKATTEAARLLQAKRDDRRACDAPSRTHRSEQVRAKKALEGLKKQRALSIADMNEAILEVSANAMRERGAAAPPQPHNLNTKKPNIRAKRDICT